MTRTRKIRNWENSQLNPDAVVLATVENDNEIQILSADLMIHIIIVESTLLWVELKRQLTLL